VKVLEVDGARKRISLTMKLDAAARPAGGAGAGRGGDNRFQPAGRGQQAGGRRPETTAAPTAMASAFSKLKGIPR
jgi:uncharacterized protein